MFGDWQHRLSALHDSFRNATPFPHVVIDDFLAKDVAERVLHEYPTPSASAWCVYDNPIERKYARNDFDGLPLIARVFSTLQSSATIDAMRTISGIPDLENDPHLHGAGLHYHPRGGKLDMHLDYSIHPITGKERRLNLILYLNPSWKDEYGGHLELWDKDFSECEASILPSFNRAVLFQTSDLSYHGMPRPLRCPPDTGRRSLAIYYVSPPRQGVTHRPKASFRPLPGQVVPPGLQTLYDLRSSRRLTQADVDEHFPEFEIHQDRR